MKSFRFTPSTMLRLIASAALVLGLLFPTWATVLQVTAGYYYDGGGNTGGGGGAADAVSATAIPTLSYWGLVAVVVSLFVLALLQRKRGKDNLE